MKKLLPVAITCLLTINSFSQSIGIGTATPQSSSVLDISSADKGLLIPRMTTSGITSINNPAKGLLVYDSLKNQLMVNMGSASVPDWQTIVFNSGWSLGGNKGLDPTNNFIGTTDNVPLVFKAFNKQAGKVDVKTDGNTFFGLDAGKSITSGTLNVGLGRSALAFSATGSYNTAIGYEAGANTNGSYNTAAGYNSLANSTSGNHNTAYGFNALKYNSTGQGNTVVGSEAMEYATGANSSYNTAMGNSALTFTTNSQYNTCIGFAAGFSHNMGYNNTIIGANCDINGDGYYNCIAIGQAVTNTAVSQARIGNAATNSIGGYANWSNISDGRYKKDIQDNVKGIDFIMKLRPVTYHLDVSGLSNKLKESRGRPVLAVDRQAIAEKERIVFSGFVAQEVEKAAAETGYDFSGLDKPKNANDLYALRYAEFVVPLVKGMQEQQELIKESKQEINLLRQQNGEILKRIEKLESLLTKQQ